MTRITIIFLVACLTLMARETREAIANPKSIVQAKAKSTVKPIPVALPRNGTVFLNSGDSRSGSVIDVNSEYITVKKGRSRGRVAIANVKEIRFYGDPWWLTSDGMTVLRGDDVDKIGKVRRFEVGVDGLVWTNADQNPIEIKPESVIRVDEGEDIPRGMKNIINARYVVSKMEFEPERQIWIITATLQSRKE